VTAPHVKLNRGAQTGQDRAAAHLDALTRAYGRALRAAGRRAAARFRQIEPLTAATAPKQPPGWTPPPIGQILDQQQLAQDTQRKTAKLHRVMLDASGTAAASAVGISFDVTAPTSKALLDALGTRIQSGISSAITEQIQGAVKTGYATGQSVPQVARAILTATDAISRPRATMLARTDLVALANGGSLLAASISGAAATKTWLSAGDDLVRPDHEDTDGQTVAIDDNFDVGGEQAQYPGDPSLSDDEAINCRCTLTYGEPLTASAGIVRAGGYDGVAPVRVHRVRPSSEGFAVSTPGVLYLARHALTAYDSDDPANDTIRGWKDDPLTDAGFTEAERLAVNLKGRGITKIQASDLQRAAETATVIGAALEPAPTLTDKLRPWNLGDFQGRASADAAAEISGYVDHPNEAVPGGESFNDFSSRFLPVLADAMAAAENGATPLLVAHSHNLKLARAWIANGRQPVTGDEFCVDSPAPASVFAFDPADGWAFTETLSDGDPLAETGSVPARVHYRPSDDPDRECGTCAYFSAGECSMFDAAVLSDYVCDEFAAKSALLSGGNMSSITAKLGPDQTLIYAVEGLTSAERAQLRAQLDEPLTPEQTRLAAARDALAAKGVAHVYDDDEVTAVLAILDSMAATRKHAYAGNGGPCKICGMAGSNKDAHFSAGTIVSFEDAALLAASTDGTPWQATLCVGDQPTVDSGIKRLLLQGGGSWRPLPLPLALLDDSPHADVTSKAPICGRIDQIWWAGNVCQASGVFFDGSSDPKVAEAGSKAAALVGEMRRLGISVDLVDVEAGLKVWNGSSLDDMDEANDPTASNYDDPPGGPATETSLPDDVPEMMEDEPVEYIMAFTSWCIAGATICPVQALTDATISIVASAFDRQTEWRSVTEFETPEPEPLTAAAAGLVPLEPPRKWFDDPQLAGPTPLTVTDEGRVFGHLAAWDTCHTGRPGCVPPPRSPTGYMNFHLGEIVCQDGERVAVGTLTFDAPHAGQRMTASQAIRHYDDTATSGAHVRAGEDQYGIWLAGALNPRISAEEARTLMASTPSGDWRQVNRGEGIDLVGAHAVNQPGFIVQRKGLYASAEPCEPCEESLARELAVLAASADGIEGLAALVEA
jgi:broad specificity phosphatase PhoE